MQTTAPWNVERKEYNMYGLRNATKEETLLALAGWEEEMREARAAKWRAAAEARYVEWLAEAEALAPAPTNPPVAGTLVYANKRTSVWVYQTHYRGDTVVTYKRTPAHARTTGQQRA